ncbi:hypothetical protein B484DRAFT_30392, partial [Ochromonadaceae sp. CCMP2298]
PSLLSITTPISTSTAPASTSASTTASASASATRTAAPSVAVVVTPALGSEEGHLLGVQHLRGDTSRGLRGLHVELARVQQLGVDSTERLADDVVGRGNHVLVQARHRLQLVVYVAALDPMDQNHQQNRVRVVAHPANPVDIRQVVLEGVLAAVGEVGHLVVEGD